jgi:hypothetical protein
VGDHRVRKGICNMTHKELIIQGYHLQINEMLSNRGYSVRLKSNKSGKRFEWWLNDITVGSIYHTREYGRLTIDKSLVFVEAFYNGLNLGLLGNPI